MPLMNCENCGREKFVTQSLINRGFGKYCSRKCFGVVKKGKKLPGARNRTPWTEERKNRQSERLKGKKRPESATKPMLEANKKKRANDPEKYRKIAINNLSNGKGNLSKENSPNWKGGITSEHQTWKNNHKDQFKKHRANVLERDGYKCKVCSSVDNLHVHHIVSVRECREVSFLRMNGVTLCNECHHDTENYGGKESRKSVSIGNTRIIIKTIPHIFHDFTTIGNWGEANGVILIFISELKDDTYFWPIALHEIIEAAWCQVNNISSIQADAFDEIWEEEIKKGLQKPEDEAGFDPRCPYGPGHRWGARLERIVCHVLGINWKKYCRDCEDIFK